MSDLKTDLSDPKPVRLRSPEADVEVDAACELAEDPLLRDPAVLKRLERMIGAENTHMVAVIECIVNLVRTYNAVHERLNGQLIPFGCSLAKYNLLILLYNAPDYRLQMSELGASMSVTCANITRLVDGLERDGLVRRTDLPGDRRVVIAELTDEGRAAMTRIVPQRHAAIFQTWGDLSEAESRQLTHLLMRLRQQTTGHPTTAITEDTETNL